MAILQSKTPCIESHIVPNELGYCRIERNKKLVLHHRWVWEQHHGPIPKGLMIRHLCHNKKCINIEHLAIGTMKDNRQDDIDAGRMNWQLSGEACGASKLTEAQAREILALKPSGKSPHGYLKAIRLKYGVGKDAIHKIWKRTAWKHL